MSHPTAAITPSSACVAPTPRAPNCPTTRPNNNVKVA